MTFLANPILPRHQTTEVNLPTVSYGRAVALPVLAVVGDENHVRAGQLLDFSRQLSVATSLSELCPEIAQRAVEIVRAQFCRVLVRQPGLELACHAVQGTPGHAMSEANKVVSPAEQRLYLRALSNRAPVYFRRPAYDPASFSSPLSEDQCAVLCLAPMHLNSEAVGLLVLGVDDERAGEPRMEDQDCLVAYLAEQSAAAIYRVGLSKRLQANQLETVLALAKALEARDEYTAGHGQRIMVLAERIADNLGCEPGLVETIRWASLLHDIGKIGISDEVLRRCGPLSEREWELLKKHPQVGAEIVMTASNLSDVAELIHCHHERFDGRGYPRGLVGDEIPLGARIIAVADAFSSITDGRVYRPASTSTEARAEIRRCSGSQFDPGVVEAFLRLQ